LEPFSENINLQADSLVDIIHNWHYHEVKEEDKGEPDSVDKAFMVFFATKTPDYVCECHKDSNKIWHIDRISRFQFHILSTPKFKLYCFGLLLLEI